ncbi:MAG: ligand-gated channel protein, partial [Rickettsiales bacterium]|nr:ligand-gated channel protein [Rickettsiales bacterium]
SGDSDGGDSDGGDSDGGDSDGGDSDGGDSDGAEQDPSKTSSPELRETISVIARRSGPARVAGSAHTVDQETLELFEHNDIHKVLAPVPGVYIREEDGFGLRPNIGLRGASSDRSSKITLMEDGILLAPAPYSAPAAYYFPLSTRMVGVEVFKGAAAIRHGPNTIGGAINMQTRPIPTGPDANLDIALGTYQTEKVHIHGGTRTDWGGFLIEGVHLASGGFKQIDGGGNTGFVKQELMFKGRLNTPLNQAVVSAWELKLGYSRERSNETYLGLSRDDFEAAPNRRYAASQLGLMKWQRTQLEFAWQLQAGSNFELRAVGYHHGFQRAWRKVNGFASGPSLRDILDHPDAGQSAVFFAILRGEEDSQSARQQLRLGTNDRQYHSYGAVITANWRKEFKKLESNTEFGIRLHGDQIERNHFEEAYAMQQGQLTSADSEPVTTLQNIGKAFAFAGHVHEELNIGPFTAVPGLRLEVIRSSMDNLLADQQSAATRAILLPGLGLHLQARPWLSFLAGVHRGFSPASPGQAAEVKPEESWNIEAGARLGWQGTSAEVVGFFNNYSNLTGTCTLSSGCDQELLDQQFNAGKVFVYGLEAMFEQRFELPAGMQLRAGGSYTWTGSRFRSDFNSASSMFGAVSAGDKLPYVPEHQGAGHLTLVSPISSFELAVTAQSPMRDLPGQGEIAADALIPEHATLELAAHLRLLPHLSIYATVNNLTNASYLTAKRPYGSRGTRPVHAMFGLKVAAAPSRSSLWDIVDDGRR